VKIHSNVKLLEIDLDRKHFTRHVQLLSLCSKEVTSLKLAMIIGQFYKGNQLASVYIPWKTPPLDGANSESEDLNTEEEITKSSQTSKCWRNCPALKNPDFYGHKLPPHTENKWT
jgi:hypothetical protein